MCAHYLARACLQGGADTARAVAQFTPVALLSGDISVGKSVERDNLVRLEGVNAG